MLAVTASSEVHAVAIHGQDYRHGSVRFALFRCPPLTRRLGRATGSSARTFAHQDVLTGRIATLEGLQVWVDTRDTANWSWQCLLEDTTRP